MEMPAIFFYVFASIAIACSLLVVLKRSAVASAFSMVLAFFAFAGIYALLGAHLIAGLQILVYAGAVMVLFVFVIMLLNADIPALELSKATRKIGVITVCLIAVLLSLFVKVFKSESLGPVAKRAFNLDSVEAAGGNTRVVAELMFSEYVLPFELTSVLLLGAIVGIVAIAMRHNRKESK